MENISPRKLPQSPWMPLFPVSPERINASKQALPQSPSLPAFTSFSPQSPDFSPSHRHKNSDVQGMVARFNALEIKDHQELRHRDEAALRRAQMGREQAEEDCKMARQELRSLRRDVEESRERERRAAKRAESVIEQLHSEKERSTSMQKTYEREIRRARKEAFKSSSALLETQKELKVTKAALNAAKVNLEKWVIPDGEELKARAEDFELELGKALKLVEHMKIECQFGVCSCRLAEMKGEIYVADADQQIMSLMKSIKPTVADVVMDEEPPAYEEPVQRDEAGETTPIAASTTRDEKHDMRSASPRRSSTVQPPGEMMVFSPNSGTFRRAPQSDLEIATPHAEQYQRGSSHHFAIDSTVLGPSHQDHYPANDDEPTTPTTPVTSVPAFSPRRDFLAASEDEQDNEDFDADNGSVTPTNLDEKSPLEDQEGQILEDIEETVEEDEEPLESPTAHIRATTQITTIPLAPMSSPSRPAEQRTSLVMASPNESISQPDFQSRSEEKPAHPSRATTPMPELSSDSHDFERGRHVPITPKLDTDLANNYTTPAPKLAPASDENILSSTPWANSSTTPLTRDEAIAMLRARRGRARSQAEESKAETASNTPKRSASQGQRMMRKGGAVTPGRRDISTVSAPDMGRTPRGRR